MIHRRQLLHSLAFFIFSNTLFAQDFFQKTYNTELKDEAWGVETTSNGDILTAGLIAITDPVGINTLWIQRLNAQGAVLWSKTYTGFAAATDIQRAAIGDGYWVSFNADISSGQTQAGWMKISENGDVLFSQKDNSISAFSKILPLSDGGLLLVGHDMQANERNAVALKINAGGNVLWRTSFGVAANDAILSCWEDIQGFVYCVGYSGSGISDRDGFLAKLSPAGSVLWARRYGTAGSDQFSRVQPFSGDSTLLLAGYSSGYGLQDEVWLTQVATDGSVRWSRTYSLPAQNLGATDMLALPGNQFLVSVADPNYQPGSPAVLMKVDEGGDLLWVYQYKTGGERDIFQRILSTTGGFVAVGSSAKNDDENMYVAKVAADGLIPGSDCCPTFVELTVIDVVSKNDPFTPNVQVGFSTVAHQTTAGEVLPETIDLCTPIDVEFILSDSTICPKECVEIELVGNTPGVVYSLEIQGGETDPLQPEQICHTEGSTLHVIRRGNNSICKVELIKSIPVGPKADAFPNAFTPNGDGVNDTFKPLFFCPVVTTDFKIYNRWGKKVFETQDPDKAWDGKVDGADAPSDVYVWQLEYEAEREGSRQKLMMKGDVALLR